MKNNESLTELFKVLLFFIYFIYIQVKTCLRNNNQILTDFISKFEIDGAK